jgi:hypothetical protein
MKLTRKESWKMLFFENRILIDTMFGDIPFRMVLEYYDKTLTKLMATFPLQKALTGYLGTLLYIIVNYLRQKIFSFTNGKWKSWE